MGSYDADVEIAFVMWVTVVGSQTNSLIYVEVDDPLHKVRRFQ